MNHEDHESHEGHHLRVTSPLSDETERVITRTIGCAIEVHRALGAGFLESIYAKAMCVELAAQRLAFEREKPVMVTYRDVPLDRHRLDLLVENCLVVELKAVARFEQIHRAQIISYLHATKLRAGLLINFRVPFLVKGLQRIVL